MRRQLTFALALLLGLAAVRAAGAQDVALPGASIAPAAPAPEQAAPLTLRDAVRIARERRPLIQAAAGHVRAIRGEARQDGAFPNPTLGWQREGIGDTLDEDRFLTAELPIDLSGRRLAVRAAGNAAVRGARADSLALLRQVEYDAAAAYIHAALALELLAVEAARREAIEGIAAFDAIRLAEGAVAEVAAMRTRLEADRARLAEAEARAEASRALAELAHALALPVDSVRRLEPVPFPALAPPSLEAMLERAITDRPELQAARAEAEAARHRRSAARRGLVPEFALVGGVKETGGERGAIFGVSVPVPLFDRNGGARERAAGELLIADALVRDAESRVRAEVTAAVLAYEELLTALPADRKALGSDGEEVARIMEAAYREGGASLVEVLEARHAAADARASELRWAAQLQLALLDLNRATGAPIVEDR